MGKDLKENCKNTQNPIQGTNQEPWSCEAPVLLCNPIYFFYTLYDFDPMEPTLIFRRPIVLEHLVGAWSLTRRL